MHGPASRTNLPASGPQASKALPATATSISGTRRLGDGGRRWVGGSRARTIDIVDGVRLDQVGPFSAPPPSVDARGLPLHDPATCLALARRCQFPYVPGLTPKSMKCEELAHACVLAVRAPGDGLCELSTHASKLLDWDSCTSAGGTSGMPESP